MPEQQQGKARGEEDDDGHVGTGGGEGRAQGPPDLAQHGDSGQRADRQGQVHPAPVPANEPVADGQHCDQGEGRRGDVLADSKETGLGHSH